MCARSTVAFELAPHEIALTAAATTTPVRCTIAIRECALQHKPNANANDRLDPPPPLVAACKAANSTRRRALHCTAPLCNSNNIIIRLFVRSPLRLQLQLQQQQQQLKRRGRRVKFISRLQEREKKSKVSHSFLLCARLCWLH